MIASLLTCVMLMSPTVDDIKEYQHCRETNVKVEYVKKWQPTIEQYFEEENVLQAMLIIYCESRGKPNAVGINKDNTKDIGLWQFNDRTWKWLSDKLDIKSSRTNPRVSTAVASWLVYNDGWHHWNSSKHCWKGNNG